MTVGDAVPSDDGAVVYLQVQVMWRPTEEVSSSTRTVGDAVPPGDGSVVYLQVQIAGGWREETSGARRGPPPVGDAVQPGGLHADDAGAEGGGEKEDPPPAGQVAHWPAVQPGC